MVDGRIFRSGLDWNLPVRVFGFGFDPNFVECNGFCEKQAMTKCGSLESIGQGLKEWR